MADIKFLITAGQMAAYTCIAMVGSIALYCACFLYEDEEGNLQNRILQLWVRIDDRHKLGKSLVLASKVAGMISRGFDRVLGRQLVSVRMIGMSMCLSLVPMYLRLAATLLDHHLHGAKYEFTVPLGTVSILVLITASPLETIRNPKSLFAILGMYVVPLVTLIVFTLFFRKATVLIIITAFALGIISDVTFIAIVRASLRKLALHPTSRSLTVAVLAQLAVILLLFMIPLAVGVDLRYMSSSSTIKVIGSVLAVMSAVNIITAILSGLFIVTLICLSLHRFVQRFFWSIAGRLLYPIVRFSIIRNRKIMVTIAIGCFAMITPSFSELLKKVSELFR